MTQEEEAALQWEDKEEEASYTMYTVNMNSTVDGIFCNAVFASLREISRFFAFVSGVLSYLMNRMYAEFILSTYFTTAKGARLSAEERKKFSDARKAHYRMGDLLKKRKIEDDDEDGTCYNIFTV